MFIFFFSNRLWNCGPKVTLLPKLVPILVQAIYGIQHQELRPRLSPGPKILICWSICFIPDQKLIYKLCQTNLFLCQTKWWFPFQKFSLLSRYKKIWSGTKCNSIFGNDQRIWDNTKYFGTCRRTGHETSFQPGVLSASDALQKIQTRRKRPRKRVRNNKHRLASRISAQAGQHAVGLWCLRNKTKSLKTPTNSNSQVQENRRSMCLRKWQMLQ